MATINHYIKLIINDLATYSLSVGFYSLNSSVSHRAAR